MRQRLIALLAVLIILGVGAVCGPDCLPWRVEFAHAAPAIPIIGAPSDEATRTVERALAAFAPDELVAVTAVHFADADGRLRGFDNGWAIVSADPTTCGESWPDPAHHFIVLRDRPDCMALLSVITIHELAHLVSGDGTHGPVFMACWLGHLAP